MKRLITSLSILMMVPFAMAQFVFSDDFESYSNGDYLALSSPTWTTWSGTEGGAEDVQVTNTASHAGSNSIYFSSTSNPGGPQDVVLPFGSQFTTGTYVLDWWMNVNSGASAYFNFQQNTTIGEVWNSEWYFNTDGTFDVSNTTGLSFSGTYPQGQWFHLVVTVNLNNASWNVNIDGGDQGTFHNNSLGIASIDFFPLQGDQYYIDDVSITHTPNTGFTDNLTVCNLTNTPGIVGSNVTVQALLRNVGTNTINDPYISLYHDGSLLGSETHSGLNLAANDTQLVTLSIPVTLGASGDISADGQVSMAMVDDDDTNDDTISYSYTAVTPASNKMVVGEQGTGTWCQWCPRGHVFMEMMETYYGPYWQGIAVHGGPTSSSTSDPMRDEEYINGVGPLISWGFPRAMVDRLPFNSFTTFSEFETDFITRVQLAPTATILNGAQWNTGMDTLYVSLSTTFQQAVSTGNYKVACVIIENDITGTSSAYNQSNAYAGGGQGAMGGYESLGNPVPAAQMTYDYVARTIQPSFGGWDNAFTIPASVSQTETHNFFIPIPAGWDVNELKIVGLFIDPAGRIDNASSTDIATAISNGYVPGASTASVETMLIDEMGLYPNPADAMSNLKISLNQPTDVTINIYASDGKLVSSDFKGNLNGFQVLELNTSGLSNGIYMVNVLAGNQMETLKLSVNH